MVLARRPRWDHAGIASKKLSSFLEKNVIPGMSTHFGGLQGVIKGFFSFGDVQVSCVAISAVTSRRPIVS